MKSKGEENKEAKNLLSKVDEQKQAVYVAEGRVKEDYLNTKIGDPKK